MATIATFVRKGDPNHRALRDPWAPWPTQQIFDASQTETRITVQ